ncbi:MAG: hypothetical protein ABI878_02555 [Acidobacteriota bacterium]
MPEFPVWGNFYVVVGSAAGALIGLQFVVLTLISQRPQRAQPAAGATFATPTIVHFGSVLFVAALMLAPWRSAASAAIVWGIAGLAGLLYELYITHMIRKQDFYEPALEDWLFHCALPLAAFAILAGSALTAAWRLHESLFAVALSVLLFLLIGIHNAWDAVTWHVFHVRPQLDQPETTDESSTETEN